MPGLKEGAQRFWCRRSTHLTPRGGLILLNPGEPHTGEAAAGASGFAYRALCPTPAHLAPLMAELGRSGRLPSFPAPRVDDPALAADVRWLHAAFAADEPPLARESRWLALLAALVTRHGDERPALPVVGQRARRRAARRVRQPELGLPLPLRPVRAGADLALFAMS